MRAFIKSLGGRFVIWGVFCFLICCGDSKEGEGDASPDAANSVDGEQVGAGEAVEREDNEAESNAETGEENTAGNADSDSSGDDESDDEGEQSGPSEKNIESDENSESDSDDDDNDESDQVEVDDDALESDTGDESASDIDSDTETETGGGTDEAVQSDTVEEERATDTEGEGDGTDSDTDQGSDEDTGGDDDVIIIIRNGGFWDDTEGNRIEAHGGGFIFEDDTWYWFGEDKSHNSGNFRGVNCYASKDLSSWEFRRAVVTRSTHPDLDTSDRIIERPKVIYNDSTGNYVMWLHWEGQNYADAEAGVFYSDTIDGDYTMHAHFRPNNNMSRDDTLYKDDDGTAYFISSADENKDLVLYRLTDDYLDIAEQVMVIWNDGRREAPAVFKDNDTYYLVTSGLTGWDPNQGTYATAPSMSGPWSSLHDFGDSITYDTQPTYVIPIQGTKTTTYIYASDRWQDPDLQSSKYIWLPIKKNGTTLGIDYYDEWQLNLTTGEWSAYDEFLPQDDWTLLYVDSEETVDEDGRAINAFDGITSTYWHTEWQPDGPHPPPPHEIQIDMGAEYQLEGFRYLPRRDADINGTIADYEFYLSMDSSNWGEPIAAGTFSANQEEKRVSFAPTVGRYIRLVAISEINGDEWSAVAELDVLGEPAK